MFICHLCISKLHGRLSVFVPNSNYNGRGEISNQQDPNTSSTSGSAGERLNSREPLEHHSVLISTANTSSSGKHVSTSVLEQQALAPQWRTHGVNRVQRLQTASTGQVLFWPEVHVWAYSWLDTCRAPQQSRLWETRSHCWLVNLLVKRLQCGRTGQRLIAKSALDAWCSEQIQIQCRCVDLCRV